MKNLLSTLAAAALVFAGCSDMLDPMPNGGYNEGNLKNYPSMIRGFVIKAYSLLPTSYDGTEYAYLECATDNAVARDQSHAMRRLATGSLSPGDDPFAAWWGRDYEGIYYVNRFLENDLGLNTRFYVNAEIDQAARKLYQGEAYALRAWFQYDLLRKFGGRSADGELLGFPIVTSPHVGSDLVRDTYDRCVAQILADCDKALEYLEGHPEMVVVVSGGQGANEPTTEAQGMADYLEAHGVSRENMILEMQSHNTDQNLRFSAQCLRDAGIDIGEGVVIVSNGFHLTRAKMLAGRAGYENVSVLAAPSSHTPTRLKMYVREPLALMKSFLFDR